MPQFVYRGPVYSSVADEPTICDECIASGRAAAELDATFTDLGGDGWQDVPLAIKAEVLTRTPGFSGWQQERWRAHCGDAMEFVGPAGHAELEDLGQRAVDALRGELASWGWGDREIDDFVAALDRDGMPTAYVFRCRHCGVLRVYADFTSWAVPRIKLPFSEPVLNRELASADQPVWRIEVLPVKEGQTVRLEFVGKRSDWRQGVWLATEGVLFVNGATASQVTIWEDTAPRVVEIAVVKTDGLLRLYNVWDSGRGYGSESLSATSGMVKRDRLDGTVQYDCNDIGREPDFTRFSFTVAIT